ncbi:MAG TPA: UDP-N-acetylglucosamine 1-carboxyvinyltransferase [Mycobacteriales bacterium]|nr:UDP-N-acetylglucosamine 1-carboxyvinyltransferase [Mycobacteriales bacterium]
MTADDALHITGGVPLYGTVPVRGSKNAVPKMMVAALLTEQPVTIRNVSFVRDIHVVSELVEALGSVTSTSVAAGEVTITAKDVHVAGSSDLADFHNRSRIPVLTCAPLLHRTGKAEIWRPGGCSIGERPVGFHLEVLRSFGVDAERTDTGYKLTAPHGLRGGVVDLTYPSVGATEQFLLGAVVAAGDSELRNAAVEPEIMDLIGMLQRMGALITVKPNRSIQVTGVRQLRGVDYTAVPDRLEAASWASLALATDGRITVSGVRQGDLATYLNVYRRAGGDFEFSSDGAEVTFWRERPMPRPLVVETDVHPGFMTDWQPPLVTALTQADGVTVLHETVYEDRLGYTEALRALGAQIQVFTECLGSTHCRFGFRNHRHSAVIVGPAKLLGTDLHVPDLRAGFSYVLAALSAQGNSTISGASLLDRGYENFREKLLSVGAKLH